MYVLFESRFSAVNIPCITYHVSSGFHGGQVVPVLNRYYAMKAYGGMEAQIHIFFILVDTGWC
jgi:hypothetical protein